MDKVFHSVRLPSKAVPGDGDRGWGEQAEKKEPRRKQSPIGKGSSEHNNLVQEESSFRGGIYTCQNLVSGVV